MHHGGKTHRDLSSLPDGLDLEDIQQRSGHILYDSCYPCLPQSTDALMFVLIMPS